MTYRAIVLADSISPADIRLTTLEVTLPRMVLAELNTHRMFSRNSASSRAIPVAKMIERVKADPFVPERFGKNQAGMQAAEWLEGEAHEAAVRVWLQGRDRAVETAEALMTIGAHKQLANRVLEPYLWHTVIVTATEWGNFYALRAHPDAQPEIQRPAVLMREAMAASTPRPLAIGEWHLPLVPDYDELRRAWSVEAIKRISAGRCARVSYLTHDGRRSPDKDATLCDRLTVSGHLSPLEHVATPTGDTSFHGNFRGWKAMRKEFPHEADFGQTGA